MRRKGQPSFPSPMICCFFSSLKTLLMPTEPVSALLGVNVPRCPRASTQPHRPMPHRCPGPRCRVVPQYLFARYTCRNVVHNDGYQDTCSADTRSAVADGRVYADSLTPVLHRFILNRFSLQRYHRRHGISVHRCTPIGKWSSSLHSSTNHACTGRSVWSFPD